MLSKLLKYELRATAPKFGWSYLALVLSALFFGLSMRTAGWDAEGALATSLLIVYTIAIVAVGILTVVTLIQRFYTNLLGDEGYLMHTLPVSSGSLIASKALGATLWAVASVLVGLLSVFLMLLGMGIFDDAWELVQFWPMMGDMLRRIQEEFGLSLLPLLLLSLLAGLASVICVVLRLYGAMMLGHQKKKYLAPIAVVSFFVMSEVESGLITLAERALVATGIQPMLALQLSDGAYLLFTFVVSILLSLLFGALYFALTNYLMSRRLDLS